jgi:hypothetical protein
MTASGTTVRERGSRGRSIVCWSSRRLAPCLFKEILTARSVCHRRDRASELDSKALKYFMCFESRQGRRFGRGRAQRVHYESNNRQNDGLMRAAHLFTQKVSSAADRRWLPLANRPAGDTLQALWTVLEFLVRAGRVRRISRFDPRPEESGQPRTVQMCVRKQSFH